MASFHTAEIPIITSLGEEYAIMDKMFCSHPGPTWPNRMYALSATSRGMTDTGTVRVFPQKVTPEDAIGSHACSLEASMRGTNGIPLGGFTSLTGWHCKVRPNTKGAFYDGEPGKLFPQPTFFDQVSKAGLSWKNYYNDTPWELFLEGIAHNPEHVVPVTDLWTDARDGTLPSYAWINPRAGMNQTTGQGSNDQHPDHDVALGEAYIKDIYESLRASPQWNETLFIVTYDEHGGFYDHVVPPNAPPPEAATGPSYPNAGYNFTQLGVRIPTILISPWIAKGTVVSEPPAAQRRQVGSSYDLTSIMATARLLLGMPDTPLTKRDAWAGTFEHVIASSTPRTDCPTHLVDAPKPVLPADVEGVQLLNDLQRDIAAVHAHIGGSQNASEEHATFVAGSVQRDVSSWLQDR
jgi:hypothetical protein